MLPGGIPRTPTSVPATLGNVDVAVLIPCFNEELAIGTVVARFKSVLPSAKIFVYDNNSRDQTVAIAQSVGAIIRHERQQGKGHVVARMFADIDADVYVLVDGDDTYDPNDAPIFIEHLLLNQLDLVNGRRQGIHERFGHRFGNELFNRITGWIFGSSFEDMLSGYKVLSRRFVKSFPALASGFEIETAMTVHALHLRMPVDELPTDYKERPEGSTSKLHTVRDGIRILCTILALVKDERPLAFFSVLTGFLAVLAIGLAAPIAVTFIETGLVPRLPTAVLAMGIMLLAFLSLVCGLVLDTVTRGRTELKRLHYLTLRPAAEKGN